MVQEYYTNRCLHMQLNKQIPNSSSYGTGSYMCLQNLQVEFFIFLKY